MIKEAIGTGNTVDEAKAAAMLELGISDFDDFNVEVIQTPTKKILGLFGGNPAKVKVTTEVADPKPEKKQNKPNNKKNDKKPVKKVENKKEEKVEAPKAEPKVQTPELPLEETNLYKETADYIKSIVMGLGMSECEIKEFSNEEEIYFELDCGDDYGIIIGKRGETLDAIQYLARMMANKGNQSYKRVVTNIDSYSLITLVTLVCHHSCKILNSIKSFTTFADNNTVIVTAIEFKVNFFFIRHFFDFTLCHIKSIVMGLGMTECEIKEMSNEEEIYFELDCGDDYGIIIG